MTVPLLVAGSGMYCAVGYSAPAARAAIRAKLARFVDSEFVDERGQPLIVARMPLGDVWGPRRLAMMFQAVLEECTASTEGFDPARTALILLLAEPGRPGFNARWADACMQACKAVSSTPFHEASQALPLGRAGIAQALDQARQLLSMGELRHVIVAGVDSYLNAHTITQLLRDRRLQCPDVNDGFIAGEGAGAILLEAQRGQATGFQVLGVNSTTDVATHDQDDLPSLGIGLTEAIEGALKDSGYKLTDMDFRLGDLSGESFYFRETAFATTRLMERREGTCPLLHITDSIGETGAAIGPLSLAYLAGAMARGHVPGRRAVGHFSSDGGARSAVVVEYFTS